MNKKELKLKFLDLLNDIFENADRIIDNIDENTELKLIIKANKNGVLPYVEKYLRNPANEN